MNPLNLPFGKKEKSKEPVEKVPHFTGVRNEAVRDDCGEGKKITIIVRGVKGVPNGEYSLKWEEGRPLGAYFSRLKLKHRAIYSAVRNLDDLSKGKLRMNYIPQPGCRISVGDPRVSSALQYQRSNHNAESVARKMGGGANVVEVPLRRR